MKLSSSTLLLVGSIPSIASASIAITGPTGSGAGINSTSGQRPSRQDFNTFKNSGPAFDLYIQALTELQAVSQSDPKSYYQVAGIHGYPAATWDGVSGGGYQAGYCTHNSILFPTWHRPYLALYEQLLWGYAQTVADSYPSSNKATYQSAAKTFRVPYWDWARNSTIPDIVNAKTVSITTPSGRQSVTNPLYTYKFHPQPSSSDFPRDSSGIYKYTSTLRCPNSQGVSQSNVANQNLQSNAKQLHDSTYQMLASQSSYGPFSNTGWSGSSPYNNIENLHNSIHGLVGGNGHMSWIPYSSFDPIFWLHHTNVDRIFAIWQALYPNSFVPAQSNAYGTFTNKPGSTEDANSQLTPFQSDTRGTLYTSYTARSTRTFGYSYPEVVDWNVTATALAANTRAAVNKLYNPNGSLTTKKGRKSKARRDGAEVAELAKRAPADAVSANMQYALNFQGDKTKLPTSLFVHFFLGDPKATTQEGWIVDPAFIATQAVLIDPSMQATSPATKPMLKGQVQLTHVLLGTATTLAPKDAVAKLKDSLAYRAATLDGTFLPADKLQGGDAVYLEVVGREVRQTAPEDEFPDYGPWTTYAKGSFSGGTYSLGKSLQWMQLS